MGDTSFLLNALVLNVGDYVNRFMGMTLNSFAFDRPVEWMNNWTLFFWACLLYTSPVQRAANPQGREVAKQDRCQGKQQNQSGGGVKHHRIDFVLFPAV